jgi:hypothetical protein
VPRWHRAVSTRAHKCSGKSDRHVGPTTINRSRWVVFAWRASS